MNRPIVVVPGAARQEAIDFLKEKCEVRQWQEKSPMPRDLLKEWLADADGLWAVYGQYFDADLISGARNLKVVATPTVGYEHISIEALTAKGIPVSNAPGVSVETVAEFAFGILLTARRRIYENINFVRDGEWEHKRSTIKGRDLSRQTLGIIGMGRIGLSISRRARAFGMTVIYNNRHPRKDDNLFMTTYKPLDELLAESDIVLISAPLTEETYHLINAETLKKMKNTALLVNIGRGKIVDTDALVEALNTGEIDYAALDVTDPEQIESNHPLLQTGRCIITPHVASFTDRCRTELAMLAAENILLGVEKKPLKTCINSEINYLEGEDE